MYANLTVCLLLAKPAIAFICLAAKKKRGGLIVISSPIMAFANVPFSIFVRKKKRGGLILIIEPVALDSYSLPAVPSDIPEGR